MAVLQHIMPNVSPTKYVSSFTMRVDEEFERALDALRLAEKPPMSRSDYLRRLVFEEEKRAQRRK